MLTLPAKRSIGAVHDGSPEHRDDLRDQYLRAIATDCAIGSIVPFSTAAKPALNGR
jgi:hypothetical protein